MSLNFQTFAIHMPYVYINRELAVLLLQMTLYL